MSHFPVLVVGDDHEKQLAPYHEYECTGHIDEYVKEINETKKLRKEYKSQNQAKVKYPDGEMIDKSDNRFWSKVKDDDVPELLWKSQFNLPDGCELVELAAEELQSFADWASDWTGRPVVDVKQEFDKDSDEYQWGWIKVDGKGEVVEIIDRTNPNAKWDWYQVGGRWTGFFPIREGTKVKAVGEPGLFTRKAEKGYADQVQLKDVDFDRAYAEAEKEANETFDKWEAFIAKHGKMKPWSEFRTRLDDEKDYDIDQARKDYREQPATKAQNADEYWRQWWSCPADEIGYDREAYVKKVRNNTLVPHAVIKDGKWYEQGSMGWWGCVSNEKDPETWAHQYQQLMEELDPETMVTLVDCHI
jgi:hypothetical protein